MTKTIVSHYQWEFRIAFWLVGIAILNFALGILALKFWGDVGAGILVMLGSFGIYHIIWGLWTLLVERNRVERKIRGFEENQNSFINKEIVIIDKEMNRADKAKNYLLISFLFGLLCLFMGAFGGWNEWLLGIGFGLPIQSAIMLILGLLSNYRTTFYLIRLRRFVPEVEEGSKGIY